MARKRRKSTTKKWSNSKRAKINDYRSSWLEALARYLKETKTNVLDLEHKKLGTQEVKSILNFLPDSEVTDLNLKWNCNENEITDLLPLLPKTKIKRLSLRIYSKQELLQLLEVVKESQITDLDVYCHRSFDFESNEASTCISLMQKSELTALVFGFFSFFCYVKNPSLVHNFFTTSITTLDLSEHQLSPADLISVFSNLGHSSVVDLNLKHTKYSVEAFCVLCERLRETKIEKLSVAGTDLNDAGLNILIDGLVDSHVTDVDLSGNHFSSVSVLFTKIKETQIRTLNLSFSRNLSNEKFIYPGSLQCSCLTLLNLSYCGLSDEQGEGLMESLRLSNVKKLDFSHNKFRSLTVKRLAENIKDFNLIDLDISYNELLLDGVFILGDCLKESRLERVNVSNFSSIGRLETSVSEHVNSTHLISFLKLTEGSSVRQIRMSKLWGAWAHTPVYELKAPINATLTELDLSFNHIYDSVLNLFSYLKYMIVNNLNLSYNGITDNDAVAVAESLKETQIRRLNLSSNRISSQGAKVLAEFLNDSNLLHLHLNNNDIEDEGLESLAEHAKDTFMTVLDVLYNPGKKVLVVDKVLLDNKISVYRLLSIFRQITPESNNDEFRFDRNCDDSNVSVFLEKCMIFYKTLVDNPRAISVLLEESVTFSREQMCKLVFEDFPRQFSCFIASRIEADLEEHVNVLNKAEEMGVTAIVESLLLNRPVYMLDEVQGILHPDVYKLLLKYKQPICSLAVEPRGIVRIIEYFTEHANVGGAQDVIKLLQEAKIL